MKNTVKNLLTLLFALIFLVSTAMVIYRTVQAHSAGKDYSQAQALSKQAGTAAPQLQPVSPKAAFQHPDGQDAADDPEAETPTPPEPDPYADQLAATDLAALRATNPDVIGWISIPDTVVDYPLLQTTNNDYYLHRTWTRARNSAGSIFMEHTNAPDFSGFSTIIYGHRMKNGSMFGSLRLFKDQTYFQEHPFVYIVTDDGVLRYRIYAAYEAGVRSQTYHLEFPTDAEKRAFLNYGVENSVIASGIIPGVDDRILTLSTCTGTGYSSRWVLQAVLDAIYLPGEA